VTSSAKPTHTTPTCAACGIEPVAAPGETFTPHQGTDRTPRPTREAEYCRTCLDRHDAGFDNDMHRCRVCYDYTAGDYRSVTRLRRAAAAAPSDLPAGLNPNNAHNYVPAPPPQAVSIVDELGEDTTATITSTEHGTLRIALECGEPGKTRHQLLACHLGDENISALYQLIAPLVQRLDMINKLTIAAGQVETAKSAEKKAAKEAHDAAAAFEIQDMNYVSSMSYSTCAQRLHRRGCTVLARSRKPDTSSRLITLAELVTTYLPAFREAFEHLNSPATVQKNADQVRHARGTAPSVRALVVMMCGSCRPIGPRSKAVEEELFGLTGRTEHDPEVMVHVARLLAEIEGAAAETDAAYRATLATEEDG